MFPATVHDNVSFGRRIEATLSNSLSFRRRRHTPSISHCAREENPAMSGGAADVQSARGKSEIRISKSEQTRMIEIRNTTLGTLWFW
jgi:hypothetical protein